MAEPVICFYERGECIKTINAQELITVNLDLLEDGCCPLCEEELGADEDEYCSGCDINWGWYDLYELAAQIKKVAYD